LPQQAVSRIPGNDWPSRPVRLLVGDINFSVCRLPQDGQAMSRSLRMTNTSPM
jgi:hypothetical protein